MPPATHGVVRLAALDVRRRPGHQSEMGSQFLLGEVVRVLRRAQRGRWCRVENLDDGYRGWVRSWGLVEVPAGRALGWRRKARARVALPWSDVREARGRGALVSPLFWGGRVIPGPVRGRFVPVELPDGRRGWTEARALALGRGAPARLTERVRDLLGVPYLWGGRTAAGMDCSGFIQLLLAEQGFRLPRDAGDQERSARILGPREQPRPGDLAFFGPRRSPAGHVGVLLGGGYYAHARGCIRISSLISTNILFDNELSSQFRAFRRPLRKALARS